VKLGDSQGPTTRRSRNQTNRADPSGVHSSFRKPASHLMEGGTGPLTSFKAPVGGTSKVMTVNKAASKSETAYKAANSAVLDSAPARDGPSSSLVDHDSDPSTCSVRRGKPQSRAGQRACEPVGRTSQRAAPALRDEAWTRLGQGLPTSGSPQGQLSPANGLQAKAQSFRGVTWDKVKQVMAQAFPT
jgi:hypothetical protein